MNGPSSDGPGPRSGTARWDDPRYQPTGEPSRIARYRRLQSWYREVQLGAEAGPYPTRNGNCGATSFWLGRPLPTSLPGHRSA